MSNPFLNQLKEIHALNFIFEWNLKVLLSTIDHLHFLQNDGSILLIKLFFLKYFILLTPILTGTQILIIYLKFYFIFSFMF